MKEWSKAALVAIPILALVYFFIARWVIVDSTSMYATLLPGDVLLVDRTAAWNGYDRNDIVVFHDPVSDHLPLYQRPLLVKRIAGMPGDKVQMLNGDLYVDGAYIPPPATGTSSFILHVDPTAIDGVLNALQLPKGTIPAEGTMKPAPLNDEILAKLKIDLPDLEAEEMGPSTGYPRNIFPFSPQHRWNNDDHGPLRVPAKGDTIAITMHDLPLYDRIITHYEGHKLSVSGDSLLMDGAPLRNYVIAKNYYFVLGDSRDHSADSRYWGFVPEDHLIGKATHVIVSSGEEGLRKGRCMRSLQ